MAGQTIEGDLIREIELKIDKRYASILVVPKADEVGDANMPGKCGTERRVAMPRPVVWWRSSC